MVGIEEPLSLQVPYETPRELDAGELPALVASFREAAKNAMEAGFDAVEVHSANGFLLDQFLEDGSNHRSDAYGGSIENRARLLLEVMDGIASEIGKDRLGVRLSPHGNPGGLSDSDTVPHFSYVIAELGRRGIAYLHMIEPRAFSAGFGDDASIDSANNEEDVPLAVPPPKPAAHPRASAPTPPTGVRNTFVRAAVARSRCSVLGMRKAHRAVVINRRIGIHGQRFRQLTRCTGESRQNEPLRI
jgi:2,4-dienoyl-CoA reductase-like NADH-dependent reductase (Old Yellow Enzyme family)